MAPPTVLLTIKLALPSDAVIAYCGEKMQVSPAPMMLGVAFMTVL